MAKSDLTLRIGTKYDGEGFKKLNQSLKESQGTVRKVTGATAGLIDQMGNLGGKFSGVTNQVTKFAYSFMSGGVWGLAIAGVSALIGKFVSLREEQKKLDEQNRQAAISVQQALDRQWKKHQEILDLRRKETAAAEKAARIKEIKDKWKEDAQIARDTKKYNDWQSRDRDLDLAQKEAEYTPTGDRLTDAKRSGAFEIEKAKNAYDDALKQYLNVVERLGRYSEEGIEAQLALKEAQVKLTATTNRVNAQILRLEREKEERILDEAAKAQDEIAKAQAENAKALKQKADEEQKKKTDQEKQQLKDRERNLVNAINGVKSNLSNIQNARQYDPEKNAGEDTFSEWSNNRRRSGKAERDERRRKERNIQNAQRQSDALEERLFDRHGKLRRLSNPKEVQKFKELQEYIRNGKENLAKGDEQGQMKELQTLNRTLADVKAKLDKLGL